MKKSLLIPGLLVVGCLIVGPRASYSEDGTVQHQSGGVVSDADRSPSSYGGFTKNADGMTSGSRSTTAQSKTSEVSYQGNASESSTEGLQHTSSCTTVESELVTCSAVK